MIKWYWCELCKIQCVACEHCKNTSCNGSGCEKCYKDFIEANNIISEGKAPKKEDCIIIPNGMKELLKESKED